jgi:hypothetical protein
MPVDLNTVTPSGKTFAEIDADEARYVAGANDALALLRECGGRWWRYMVSHRTFQLVVGDPMARGGNLVIELSACESISGPVSWENQRLMVLWENNREMGKGWLFTLRDESAGFTAVARTFGWQRNVDLLAIEPTAARRVDRGSPAA